MGMVCSGMFSSSARLLQTFVCGRESLALVAPSLVVAAWLIGAGLPLIHATAAGQRLDALYLFARLLIDGGVPEVDVPVQARVRVVHALGAIPHPPRADR